MYANMKTAMYITSIVNLLHMYTNYKSTQLEKRRLTTRVRLMYSDKKYYKLINNIIVHNGRIH